MPIRSRVREYRGQLSVPSLETFNEVFTTIAAAKPVVLHLGLAGINIFEGFADENPSALVVEEFKGRKTPKLDPELVGATWYGAAPSSFEGDFTGIRLYDGVLKVDAFRIRGHNHPSFNTMHSNPRIYSESELTFVRDPSWGLMGSLGPLVADVNLQRFILD